jgi:hypothetical protein
MKQEYPTPRWDIFIQQNASWNSGLIILEYDNTSGSVPVDLSGYIFSGSVRRNFSDKNAILYFRPSGSINSPSGSFAFELYASDTKNINNTNQTITAVWDAYLIKNTESLRVFEGFAYLVPAATKL